ncbi:MAG: tetratricopeptide repeat protein [Melioribacteraceae bacterium]
MKKIFPALLIALIMITACNSNKDMETFNAAEKKYNDKKYSEALIDYKLVIEEYSSSDYAAKSLMRVGSMYQMFLVPNVQSDESNKKAVEYYRDLYKNFPKSEEAPKALFMSGFILANNLNKLDEAKMTYQTFLDKFPKHELAPQIKIELENLGKTPEEILENKLSSK